MSKRGKRWTLTPPQLEQARAEGSTRQGNATARGGRHRNNRGNDYARDLVVNQEAAATELAFALFIGGEWTGVKSRHAPDVVGPTGTEYEIKHTTRPNGRLIIQLDEQRPDRTFVLVTGQQGEYVIRGHVLGHDGMNERYKWGAAGRPAYFVPQSDLQGFKHQATLF